MFKIPTYESPDLGMKLKEPGELGFAVFKTFTIDVTDGTDEYTLNHNLDCEIQLPWTFYNKKQILAGSEIVDRNNMKFTIIGVTGTVTIVILGL